MKVYKKRHEKANAKAIEEGGCTEETKACKKCKKERGVSSFNTGADTCRLCVFIKRRLKETKKNAKKVEVEDGYFAVAWTMEF